MGLCVSGVSGGVAIGPTRAAPLGVPQLGGVTLSAVGDYAVIFVSNSGAPGGPDVSGIFALSGSFVGAGVRVDFVTDYTNWASGNWQALNNVIRNDTNAYVNGAFFPASATALQLNPGNVSSLYAIRVYLTALTSGTMLVSGNTNPGSEAGTDGSILAQVQASNTINKALLLAMSDMMGVNYLDAFGGTY